MRALAVLAAFLIAILALWFGYGEVKRLVRSIPRRLRTLRRAVATEHEVDAIVQHPDGSLRGRLWVDGTALDILFHQ